MDDIKKKITAHIDFKNYKTLSNERFTVFFSGVIVNNDNSNSNILDFLSLHEIKDLNFNKINGWYKIVIYDKFHDLSYFWGDNSGSQYFYYDVDSKNVSDSFLRLRREKGDEAKIDYLAAIDVMRWNRAFFDHTLVEGIKSTNADMYYVLTDNGIEEHTKSLTSFSKVNEKIDVNDVIEPILNAINKDSICAVCTGGTDSRVINAVLNNHGIKCNMFITGYPDNPDIAIAQEITKTLEVPLSIIKPNEREKNWLNLGYEFLDGCYDAVASYRHYQKSKAVSDSHYLYEFGGSGGEFYKNAFIRKYVQERGSRVIKEEQLFEVLLKSSVSSQKWCGEKLKEVEDELNERYRMYAKECMKEETLELVCNRLGFDILRNASGPIANGYSKVCTKVDPLMDRNLIATVSHTKYNRHWLHMWQRKQVMKYCPEISRITTNMNMTCSTKIQYLIRDAFIQGEFDASRVIARLKRKIGLKYKSADQRYWDRDYLDARRLKEWSEAVGICKKLGVLNSNISDNDIPLNKTGNILQIGMLFM